ncbi:hypothetical protein HER14_19620 [Acidithiobacillus thiooxidans]|uniref:hypothetical protein n=1 Tax=Acidithiobacillus thiooxidans TaxID=930 RepID=UPI001C067903|nr:hypothetical protein [Acidithiobacillus thiooxidans]MBU2753075.1 hypothetical protein [Acidithiobacillus thiooxidans]
MFNPYQKAVLRIYEEGEYSNMTTMDEVEQAGDGLFTFIMRELGDENDCDSQAEAERRIEVAISQLDEIYDRLEQEIEDE